MALLSDYARTKNLPYEECGKLVVALHAGEHGRLDNIYQRAIANGVPDVQLVGPQRIRELEPNAVGTLALYSPHTAIIDFAAVTRCLLDDVQAAGGRVRFNTEVVDISRTDRGCTLMTQQPCDADRQTETFDYLISCAGLQSDRLAQLAGGATYPKIVPFFGQYSQLEPAYRNILQGLVYPVPDPAYPFLGVHLTKRVDGQMLVGPNAFLSLGRENYSGWQLGVADTFDVVRSRSFWQFAGRNFTAAFREFAGVISRKRFVSGATAYVSTLAGASSQPITRGIRAQAMDANGRLVDDFVIEHLGRATFLRNAPSPGATSSLAIAEHLVETLTKAHNLAAD